MIDDERRAEFKAALARSKVMLDPEACKATIAAERPTRTRTEAMQHCAIFDECDYPDDVLVRWYRGMKQRAD